MSMHPGSIDEMSTEVAARVRGVVFDIDDTVTRNGRLERDAFDAMWDLVDAGVYLLSVTGRPIGWCEVLARHWPVDAAVGENGAGFVWRGERSVRTEYFDPPEERARQHALLDRVRARAAREVPHVRETRDQGARRCDLAFDIGEEQTVSPDDLRTLTQCIEAEGARAIVSSVHAHAAPGVWDKACGVRRAAQVALGIDLANERERWVFIGDSGNDAAAFAWFEVTVGVRNVEPYLESLPTPPRWITAGDRGRGFAELARHLLEPRAGRR